MIQQQQDQKHTEDGPKCLSPWLVSCEENKHRRRGQQQCHWTHLGLFFGVVDFYGQNAISIREERKRLNRTPISGGADDRDPPCLPKIFDKPLGFQWIGPLIGELCLSTFFLFSSLQSLYFLSLPLSPLSSFSRPFVLMLTSSHLSSNISSSFFLLLPCDSFSFLPPSLFSVLLSFLCYFLLFSPFLFFSSCLFPLFCLLTSVIFYSSHSSFLFLPASSPLLFPLVLLPFSSLLLPFLLLFLPLMYLSLPFSILLLFSSFSSSIILLAISSLFSRRSQSGGAQSFFASSVLRCVFTFPHDTSLA